MSDRSEWSANRDLASASRQPRPLRPRPKGSHWVWQALFAIFCGLVGALFAIWGLST